MKLTSLFALSATALALVACGASSSDPSDSADALKPGEMQFYGAKVAAAEADLPKWVSFFMC